ncbi:MAG: hypothetical protein ACJ77X_03185 [Chloroflexota bacterium]
MEPLIPIMVFSGVVGIMLATAQPLTPLLRRRLLDRREVAPTNHAVEIVAATDPWTEFDRELERTRRTERPCALLWTHSDAASLSALDIAAVIVDRLRAVDRVWVEDDQVFVLLPETTADGARAATTRITSTTEPLAGLSIRQAVFPDDGLTRDALLRSVRDDRSDVVRLRETA